MPYKRAIHHPRELDSIAAFFPSLIRIERPNFEQLPSGEPVLASEVTPANPNFTIIYQNVRAAISPVTRLGEEWRNWRLEFVLEQVTHRIMLKGYYPQIKASDRLIDDGGIIYNIASMHLHSHDNITRLDTRVVSPTAIEGVS